MKKILCNQQEHEERTLHQESLHFKGHEEYKGKTAIRMLLLVLLLLAVPLTLCANDFIYDHPYGGKKVGRTDERGFIYDKPYGGNKIGRVEKGVVYDSPYGGHKVGGIEDNGKLYDKPYGGTAVGRYKDGKVYDKPYGGSAIGRTDNKNGAGYWLLKDTEDDGKK